MIELAFLVVRNRLANWVVLLLGGRRWIARRLDTALAGLATTSACVAEDVLAAPPTTDVAPVPDARPVSRRESAAPQPA
jgi:hypothetical protein